MTDVPKHWDSTIERYCFEKVSEQEIDADVRRRANAVTEFVCADLQLQPPPSVV